MKECDLCIYGDTCELSKKKKAKLSKKEYDYEYTLTGVYDYETHTVLLRKKELDTDNGPIGRD